MSQPTIPATSLVQAFELFYTRFLLRDFIGKIVPGAIFLFLSFRAAYGLPLIVQSLRSMTYMEGSALLAISWLFALSSQSLHSRILQFYFPHVTPEMRIRRITKRNRRPKRIHDRHVSAYFFSFHQRERIYAREIAEAYLFFGDATPDEKAQYERYVVIKEACGNSLFCTLLGLISFTLITYAKNRSIFGMK